MRRSAFASLVAMTALIATAGRAGAATTIGETFTPAGLCSEDFMDLQTESPGGQYTAPSDGVITRWSYLGADSPPSMEFKVARSAGGSAYTIIGQSALVTLVPSVLNTFSVQIAVRAGDIIGAYTPNYGRCFRPGSGYKLRSRIGDVVAGTTADFPYEPSGVQLDVSAVLEPDCDKDALGDETQDNNVFPACAPGPGPGPGPAPGPGPSPGPATTPPTCEGLAASIVGTEGNEALTGTAAADVIVGLGGNDVIKGGDQADVICGNGGDDVINGKSGEDVLLGDEGNDRLNGAGKNDQLFGGPGKDRLGGGFGRDRLFGGAGADQLFGGFGKDTLRGGPGKDKQVQ